MLKGIFARLFGCLCILAFGVMASHAEPAGPDDITIRDTTDYRYCINGRDQVVGPAKPPYYVVLACTDFHSTNPLLNPRCHSVFQSSHCTIEDCEHGRQRLGTAPFHPDGGAATLQYVCALVDGSEWTLIDQLQNDQENTELPIDTCVQAAFKALIPPNYKQVCPAQAEERTAACNQLNDKMIAEAKRECMDMTDRDSPLPDTIKSGKHWPLNDCEMAGPEARLHTA
jgi:hypothetical protein